MKRGRTFHKSMAVGFATLLSLSSAMSATNVRAESNVELTKFESLQIAEQQKLELSKPFGTKDIVRVIVELEGDPAISYPTSKGVRYKDLSTNKKKELQSEVKEEQSEFLTDVKADKIDFQVENTFTTVMNGVSGEVEFGDIDELEKLPNVEAVSVVNEYERPKEKPQMISSKELVETIQTWNAGFDGKGMVVGVIDTGIDYTHKDMVLTNPTPKLTASQVADLVSKEGLKGKYYTNKVPYGYNYADKNSEVLDLGPDASMHGMHVAGTVGANGDETKDGLKGVAPEAQLLALKVFGNDAAMPSTFGDIYIKAIDDGIKLGADVLNMSLGSTAGFVDDNNLEQKAIDRAVNSGVLMAISAGNSNQIGSGFSNPLATNPDIGLVGAPGLSTNSLSVASIENSKITLDQMSLKIGEETLPIAYKSQESPKFVDVFGTSKETEVVYVADGSAAKYTGKDVKGKIVFVVRAASNPNYGEIQKQAELAGAAGVIIRGLPGHGDYVSMALTNPIIPLLSLSQSDGNTLETKIKAAGGTAKVTFTGKSVQVVNSAAGKMSSFTSWGVTPDLGIKPEITAPGGQIYSTLNDGKYGVMSGTSMAAPHVAGGSALVLQKVQELFPKLTGADKVKRAKLLLMNTAKSVSDPDNNNLPYSPRRQGAGLMQLHSAVTTPVYVVNKATNEGKIELKEISSDSFNMTITATNFSEQEASYDVSTSVLTDALSSGRNALKSKAITDAKVTIDTPTVTLFPGQSKDITIKVDLKDAKTALEGLMKNGYFVEGFITLTNKSQDPALSDLTIPYVGFKGDWNKPPVMDAMIYDSGSYYGAAGMVDQVGDYLGFNPFSGKYDKNLITVSPNNDGKNDSITPVVSFLRNSKSVEYSVADSKGNTLRKLTTDKEQRKNYFASSYYSYQPSMTGWDGLINNKKTEDGLYYYQVKNTIDFAGKDQQVLKVPVMVDTTAPTVTHAAYSSKTGNLSLTAEDAAGGSGLQYIDISINGVKKGSINPNGKKAFKVPLGNVADGSTIEIMAYDYGFNHSGQTLSGKWDNTIPYIITDSPEALGVYDTREVPLSGYVSDGSKVEYLKIKGEQIQGSELNLNLVYNATLKRYEFSNQIKFTEDGIHDIYFEGADEVGNKIEFRRQIIVDTEGPTLQVDGIPANHYVPLDGENPEVTVTVEDNFDELRLQVNGSEEFKTKLDEPYERRALKKEHKMTLNLKEGLNDFQFVATDLSGHKLVKTITIYQGEQAPKSFITSFVSSPSEEVSTNRPLKVKAEASESIKWNAKVIDSKGDEFTLPSAEGVTYEATYTPDELAVNGIYKLILSTEEGRELKTEEFTVVNFPVTVNSVQMVDAEGNKVTSFNTDSSVSIKGDLKNLGQLSVDPVVFLQVTDRDGAVVFFKEVDLSLLNSGSKNRFAIDIPLEGFDSGSYSVEVFVWDQDNNPLTENNKQKSFTVN
ncbi:S8 family serine peptidase [Fictibacillus sp. 7GRE50]|uniref:S8 family serine peptidase n=1 Tax=Fictibacillus sp. 7GRE50 TaxID=2745878 RepID=UPI0018CF9E80|nr:S8 family serine peptidase [Fictibacillus sp. 7GRE50]